MDVNGSSLFCKAIYSSSNRYFYNTAKQNEFSSKTAVKILFETDVYNRSTIITFVLSIMLQAVIVFRRFPTVPLIP